MKFKKKSIKGHTINKKLTDGNSPCHDISHILLNPPIHCCVRKSQPYYPILSQTNSAYVHNTQFNITLPTTPNFQVAPSFHVLQPKLRVSRCVYYKRNTNAVHCQTQHSYCYTATCYMVRFIRTIIGHLYYRSLKSDVHLGHANSSLVRYH
jgi:hypothetical protein